jgi:hypothetical protein
VGFSVLETIWQPCACSVAESSTAQLVNPQNATAQLVNPSPENLGKSGAPGSRLSQSEVPLEAASASNLCDESQHEAAGPLPTLPTLPTLPNLPTLPTLPTLPNLPTLPTTFDCQLCDFKGSDSPDLGSIL